MASSASLPLPCCPSGFPSLSLPSAFLLFNVLPCVCVQNCLVVVSMAGLLRLLISLVCGVVLPHVTPTLLSYLYLSTSPLHKYGTPCVLLSAALSYGTRIVSGTRALHFMSTVGLLSLSPMLSVAFSCTAPELKATHPLSCGNIDCIVCSYCSALTNVCVCV